MKYEDFIQDAWQQAHTHFWYETLRTAAAALGIITGGFILYNRTRPTRVVILPLPDEEKQAKQANVLDEKAIRLLAAEVFAEKIANKEQETKPEDDHIRELAAEVFDQKRAKEEEKKKEMEMEEQEMQDLESKFRLLSLNER